jgi:DNA-binding winged helix-turn-helix (wHTH) protein/TolB-like protein
VTQDSRLLRFADVEFDVKAGELRRSGMTTRLEPQPARVLAMLVERAGEVVTRAELQQHVWSGDTFVDFERGLNYCIAQIRTALGDSASSPRFIETLPRRGYRFIAPVGTAPAAAASTVESPSADPGRDVPDSVQVSVAVVAAEAPRPRPRSAAAGIAMTIGVWALVIAGVILTWTLASRRPGAGSASGAPGPSGVSGSSSKPVAAVSTRPVRIAVALFDNDTKRPDYDQLAQTLTDAVVARLAADPSRLTVIGNAPILRQVRSFRDVTVIGAKLETGHVIVGQVQEIAGHLRVTAHLIRAADEGHVWAHRFEPAASDLPTLDRTVANAVADAVASKLLGR